MVSMTLAPVWRTALTAMAVSPRKRMCAVGSLWANLTVAMSPTVTRATPPVAGSRVVRRTTRRASSRVEISPWLRTT